MATTEEELVDQILKMDFTDPEALAVLTENFSQEELNSKAAIAASEKVLEKKKKSKGRATQNDDSDFFDGKKNAGGLKIKAIRAIPLSLINATHNHRVVFPNLVKQGYTYIKLIKMALSANVEDREKFVSLVDEYENDETDIHKRTIPQMAANMMDRGQIQNILVQQVGATPVKNNEGKVTHHQYGYSIIVGNHRLAALAYAFAKYGFVQSGCPVFEKNGVPFIRAELRRVNEEQALEISMDENLFRNDMTPFQKGEYIKLRIDQGWKWKDLGKRMKMSYPTLKHYYALVCPEGDLSSEELEEKFESGQINKGEAVRIATGNATYEQIVAEKAGKTSRIGDAAANSRGSQVRRTISYGEVIRKIDETKLDNSVANRARLAAFAEVISLSYDEVVRESRKRRSET